MQASSSQKANRLVKSHLPFINVCWLPEKFLSLMCSEVVSKISSSTAFPGIEVRPKSLQHPRSSFPLFKARMLLAVFQSSGTSLHCYRAFQRFTRVVSMTSFLSTHGRIPPGALLCYMILLHRDLFLALDFPTDPRGLGFLKANLTRKVLKISQIFLDASFPWDSYHIKVFQEDPLIS